MTKNFDIEIIEEYKLSKSHQEKIALLLQKSFPSYPKGQYFYNQLPTFRYLVWNDTNLIGHAGIDYRIIRVGDKIFKVFGMVDLCVDEKYQSQKIGSSLLMKIELQAKTYEIDFLLLVAEQLDLYVKHGFNIVENTSKWLMLKKQHSFGILHRQLKNCILYKSVNGKKWTEGTLDFLGTVF